MELIQGANCRVLAFKLNNLIFYARMYTHTHTHAHTELKAKEKLKQGHIRVAKIG